MEASKSRIRVFIVDDHPSIRAGIRAIINYERDLEIIGEAGDGEALLHQVAALQPDVVVMDLTMPRLGGLEATAHLKQICPKVRVLIFTGSNGTERVQQALKAGADGYVHKLTHNGELVDAIRCLAVGHEYIDPTLAASLVREATSEKLDERALGILKRAALGHTNKKIADHFGMTEKAVDSSKTRSMDKLGLSNREELVQYAIRLGWFNPGT